MSWPNWGPVFFPLGVRELYWLAVTVAVTLVGMISLGVTDLMPNRFWGVRPTLFAGLCIGVSFIRLVVDG